MKRNLIAIICGIVVAAIVITVSVISFGKMKESDSIGSNQAAEIAFNDAGINKNTAVLLKSEFEKEKGRYVFDVEFESDNRKYEYEIDASTGEIIERSSEKSDSSPEVHTVGDRKEEIKAQDAMNIALKDAKVNEKNVIDIKAEPLMEDGKRIYEVKFYYQDKKYEYEIDAVTGEIIDKEVRITPTGNAPAVNENENSENTTTTAATEPTTTQDEKLIGLDKAKEIALRDAGISAKIATFTKEETDTEDGKTVYEIEFSAAGTDFEYEIEASNGRILKHDYEVVEAPVYTTYTAEENKEYIGVEEAKKIALENASLSADKVRFTKARMDSEDGFAVYEIEFVYGGYEYEYEIIATDGRIAVRSIEKED